MDPGPEFEALVGHCAAGQHWARVVALCDLDSSLAVRFVLEPGVVLRLVCLGTPMLSLSCRSLGSLFRKEGSP